MTETILVVNAGSSSIKFQLFEVGDHDQLQRRFKGQIEGIGTTSSTSDSWSWPPRSSAR